MSLRAPKGTDDILPPVSATWRRLLRAWSTWTERYGYDLIVTPLFEAVEVFSRGVGEFNELVEKQMYTFRDKGGRMLALRPEGTASVVRSYLQAGAAGTWKVAYEGPMFRYERPQAGRRRQFYQLGVEYLGTDSPLADAEVIELGFRYLSDVRVPGLVVMINSIGDRACRPAYLQALRSYLRERESLLCDDSRRRMETNPMRVLDCKVCAPKLQDAPVPTDYLCDECERHFASVREQLDRMEVPYRLEPRLVRGLDYYTRTAFEYVATELDAAQNAVGGGGRYDGLAEALGGKSVPGVGLALGLDRIVLAGAAPDQPELDVFVATATAGRRPDVLAVVSTLRRKGFRVDFDPDGRSLKSQFKQAARRNTRIVVILGDDDAVVTVRDMNTGEQHDVPAGEVTEWL